jgi:hypothetical protein
MALKPEQLREAARVLKMKPTKERLDVFFEYIVILIEDLSDKIDKLSENKANDSNTPPPAV